MGSLHRFFSHESWPRWKKSKILTWQHTCVNSQNVVFYNMIIPMTKCQVTKLLAVTNVKEFPVSEYQLYYMEIKIFSK